MEAFRRAYKKIDGINRHTVEQSVYFRSIDSKQISQSVRNQSEMMYMSSKQTHSVQALA